MSTVTRPAVIIIQVLTLFLLYCNRPGESLSLWFKLYTDEQFFFFLNLIIMDMNLLQSLPLAAGVRVISVKGCIFSPLSYKVKWYLSNADKRKV